MKANAVRCVFASLVLFLSQLAHAADYNYVSIKGLVEQDVGRLVIPEIYNKLGLTVDIAPRPGKRAQLEATTGEKDGEIMRIFTYGENNPTVVRVPTPYYYLETMAFVKEGSGVTVNSKEDLSNYKLVKVRGVKHTDNITKGLSNVHTIDSTDKMMKYLLAGRADVALTNTTDGLLALKKLGISNVKPVDKPLAVLELYHYIHEGKADIVGKVDDAIKAMKASGELEAVIKQSEQKVISERSGG